MMTTNSKKLVPKCFFCRSTDTMVPFRKRENIFLITTLVPGIRRRYCRQCARHFITRVAPRRNGSPSD